jgi:hypothetical protein
MKLRILILLLLLTGGAFGAAPAQDRPRPEGSDRGQQQGTQHRRNEAGAVPKLLRHRADLALTDDQVEKLQEIDRKLDDQNRPYVRQLIKIRHDMKVRSGVKPEDMTSAEREELRSHLEQARPLWEQISKNNHAAMREVGEVLNDQQKAQLRDLLRKPRERNGSPGPERPRTGRG